MGSRWCKAADEHKSGGLGLLSLSCQAVDPADADTEDPNAVHVSAVDRPICAGDSLEVFFPMHTISVQAFMALATMQPFGKLKSLGLLGTTPPEAVVHFISHQWLATAHPDPDAVQLQRMQGVFRDVMEGRVPKLFEPEDWRAYSEKVSASSSGDFRSIEGPARRSGGVLTEEGFGQHVAQGDVWLDFGSVPQAVDCDDPARLQVLQQRAIRSIPAYLERCNYFWVLTPPAKHADTGAWCNFTTWRSRGWCRLEEWGNFLSTNSCPPLIITHTQRLSTMGMFDFMMACQGKPAMAPCAGAFTCCRLSHEVVLPSGATRKVPCDRDFVYPVLRQLVFNKVQQARAQPDTKSLHGLLCSTVLPMIFGGSSSSQPWSPDDLERESIDQFLDRFALRSVSEVVPPIFTAWHYATMIGHLPMLRKLSSDVEAVAMFSSSSPHCPPEFPLGAQLANCAAMQGQVGALELLAGRGWISAAHLVLKSQGRTIAPVDRAAKGGFPDMVRALLRMGAGVNCCRADGATPLHGAAQAGHAGCCRVLLEHTADVNAVNKLGQSPLHLAADPVTFHGAGEGKPEVLQLLIHFRADVDLKDGVGMTALEIARHAHFHEGEDVLQAHVPLPGGSAIAASTDDAN